MVIAVPCACGMEMSASDSHAGMFARCSVCGALTTVPRAATRSRIPPDTAGAPHGVGPTPEKHPDDEVSSGIDDLEIVEEADAPAADRAWEETEADAMRAAAGHENGSGIEDPEARAPADSVPSAPDPFAEPTAAMAAMPAVRDAANDGEAATAPEVIHDEICAVCGETAADGEALYCTGCKAAFHLRCYTSKGGCTVFTCPYGPRNRKRTVQAMQATKKARRCPACAGIIPDRAKRCRHCGVLLDPETNKVIRHREIMRKTSAGAVGSFLVSALLLLLLIITWGSALSFPLGFVAAGAFGTGLWSLLAMLPRDSELKGMPYAVLGCALAAIDGLVWLVSLASMK